jgi:hypothetical protein
MFGLRQRCRARSVDHGRCAFDRGHSGTHRGVNGLPFGPLGERPVPCSDGDATFESLEDLVDAWARRSRDAGLRR